MAKKREIIEARMKYIGRRENATYSVLEENPFLDALPPSLETENKIIQSLVLRPQPNEKDRFLPSELRIEKLDILDAFRLPQDNHVRMFRKVNAMIRSGYSGRNPLDDHYINTKLDYLVAEFQDSIKKANPPIMTAESASVYGVSGVGKSEAAHRCLSFFPQIIYHGKYGQRLFTQQQLVWLKLEIPADGLITGLAQGAIKAIDSLLGTKLFEGISKSGRQPTRNALISTMARAFLDAGLGLLVLDDLDLLKAIRSHQRKKLKLGQAMDELDPNVEELLKFMISISNTLGISTLFIGTPPAHELFSQHSFAWLRRANSRGSIIWDRMEENSEDWVNFTDALIDYQYTTTPFEMTPEIRHSLYYYSQGITKMAIMVYKAAQTLAIVKNRPLTAEIIKKAFDQDYSDFALPMKGLRENNLAILSSFPDLYFPFRPDSSDDTPLQISNSRQASAQPESSVEKNQMSSQKSETEEPKSSDSNALVENIPHRKSGLLEIVNNGEKPYESLAGAGFVGSMADFMPNPSGDQAGKNEDFLP